MNKPILCVDFDGVIHSYVSGWRGVDKVDDPPVSGALKWLCEAQKFWAVHIYSSRSKDPVGQKVMLEWMTECAFDELPEDQIEQFVKHLIFSAEKPSAFLTIDDRAVCFNGDWNDPALDPQQLLKFKPWNKRDIPRHSGGSPFLNKNGDIELSFGWNVTSATWSPAAAIGLANEILKLVKEKS